MKTRQSSIFTLRFFLFTFIVLVAAAAAWWWFAYLRTAQAPADPRCPDSRWVGIKESTRCPKPLLDDGAVNTDWEVKPLFATGTGPMADFCLYQHKGRGNAEDIEALIAPEKLRSASRDCIVVSPAGDPVAKASCGPFRSEFLKRAGKPAQFKFDPDPMTSLQSSVRLALLDTIPTVGLLDEEPEDVAPVNSRHGTALAYLAKELLCDGPNDCTAEVVSRLAMSCTQIDKDGAACFPDPDKGGYVGTPGELAQAIETETDAWKTHNGTNDPTDTDHKLILHLALGWDDGLFPEMGVDSVPTQSVLAALERAACEGALVLAAAGNPIGGPNKTERPLLPADWEKLAAPDQTTCREKYPEAPGNTANRPLVYAVGGLRFDGRPVALARDKSRPRLAAFADHWCAKPADLATLTGTSVATTVVAAAAAAAWQADPTLDVDGVMNRVYMTGEDLGDHSDFVFGLNDSNIRRTSVCRAFHDCDENPCAPCIDLSTDFFDFSNAPELNLGVIPTFNLSGMVQTIVPGCPGPIWVDPNEDPLTPEQGCPFDTLPGVSAIPYCGPQPPDDPCPTCSAGPGGGGGHSLMGAGPYQLLIEIPEEFEGTLGSPVLTIGPNAYYLGLNLKQGQHALIKGIHLGDLDQIDRLDLTWGVTINGEEVSEISYFSVLSEWPANW